VYADDEEAKRAKKKAKFEKLKEKKREAKAAAVAAKPKAKAAAPASAPKQPAKASKKGGQELENVQMVPVEKQAALLWQMFCASCAEQKIRLSALETWTSPSSRHNSLRFRICSCPRATNCPNSARLVRTSLSSDIFR
jgi:hypothetical protein